MEQGAVGFVVDVAECFQEPGGEVAVKMAGVDHQRRVGVEEFRRPQRKLLTEQPSIFLFQFGEVVELFPLGPLRGVGNDFGQEILRDLLDGNAILGLDHELLLEPEGFLEIFELGQEGDNLAGDPADDLDLGEVLFDAGRGFALDIVELHDLVLDIKIQFPAQKSAQVFVDEVVKRVAGDVAVQVGTQAAVVGPGTVGLDVGLAQPFDPGNKWFFAVGEHPFFGNLAQVFLGGGLGFAWSGGLGPVGQGGRAVLEPEPEFAGFKRDKIMSRENEHAILAGLGLDVAVVPFGGIDKLQVNAQGVGVVAGVEPERVVAQVFAGLDVELVVVGPVEFHFFAVIGNGVAAVA